MEAISFPSSTVTEAGTAVTRSVLTHRAEGHPPREQVDYSMLQQHLVSSLLTAGIKEDITAANILPK